MQKLLMIAYHYPPLAGSSGIQRTLRFGQDLPLLGWQPAVLSAHPRAYEKTSTDLLQDIPAGTNVVRAFALDARRHLAVFNRYPGWIARPDRWLSWLLGAVPAGLQMIRQHRPNVIWSTYPIPTAHLIGYWLSRFSGLPWVADFRDPMAHVGYPADPATWRSYLAVEQKVFAQASRMVFTTPGAAKLYQSRYPTQASRIQVIENGFDESSFAPQAGQPAPSAAPAALNPGKVTLLHSGIVYPEWRNPQALFAALRQLLDTHGLNPAHIRLRFRAPEHSDFLAALTATHGLGDVVQILPPIGYQAALAEMCAADGLLVLQSADCNDQIPAKVYEYIRAGKPVLGLCGAGSDTEGVLQRAGLRDLAPLESTELVCLALSNFLATVQNGPSFTSNIKFVESFSRFSKARELAQLLDEVRHEHLEQHPATP
jgi:glycosyltransferase involved in cell wall biosynthesis